MARRNLTGLEKDYRPEPAATEEETVTMGGFVPSAEDGPPREPPEEDKPAQREPPPQGDDEEDGRGEAEEEVTIGGRQFKLTRSMAEIFRAQEAAHREDLDSIRRSQRQEPPPSSRREDERTDPLANVDKELFTDPRKVLSGLADDIVTRVSRDLTQRYGNDQRRQQYMNTFYRDNKDLAGLEDVVESVLSSNLQELAALDPPQSRRRLSELVRGHVGQIVKRFGREDEGEERGTRRTTVEAPNRGQRTPHRETQQTGENNRPTSITSLLRERRQARQRAKATR